VPNGANSSTKPRRLKFTPPTPIARPVQANTTALVLRNEVSPSKIALFPVDTGTLFFPCYGGNELSMSIGTPKLSVRQFFGNHPCHRKFVDYLKLGVYHNVNRI
jgi:hypothetical protein